MFINIVASKKFHNAHTQYRADVEGFTLLRLTCGSSRGQIGGAIKTATVGDDLGTPVYPDQGVLVSAMKAALVQINSSDADVVTRWDWNDRLFAEISGQGSEEDCIRALAVLAEAMGFVLGFGEVETDRRIFCGRQTAKSNDMRELYDAICHTDGEPVYLSDGVYLEPSGELIER